MMRPDYIYIITRAHGLSTHLFTEDDYKSFVRLPDIVSFAEAVSKGDYIRKIGSIPREQINGKTLASAFGEVYVERFLYAIKISSGKVKNFVDMFVRRIEIENIKRILRAKFSGRAVSEEDLIKFPREFTYVNIAAMLESPTFDDALYHLTPSPYKEAIEFSQYTKGIGSPFPVELGIETEYFRRVVNTASKVKKGREVEKLLKVEYGTKLIYYILSIKILGGQVIYLEKYSDKMSRLMLIEPYIFNDFIRAKEDTALDVLNRSGYKWIVKYIEESVLKRSVSDLYYWSSKAFKEYAESYAARNPLNLVFLLWYLYSVEFEYRNLYTIALAKELDVKPEDIPIL